MRLHWLIKRDFKINTTFIGVGNFLSQPQLFADKQNYPRIPETDAFNRDGRVRDLVYDVKLSVGYNLLGLANIQNTMLFLNIGYAMRFLERDWGYNAMEL